MGDPLWQHAQLDDTLVPLYFFLWMALLPPEGQQALMARLHVRNTTRHDALAVNELITQLPTLTPDAPPSAVEKMLRPYADHPRVLLAARLLFDDTPYADLLERYQTDDVAARAAVPRRPRFAGGWAETGASFR